MKPLTPASPHAIIMVGIPGSGKSTFAERFAETFQAPIVNESRIAFEAGLTPEQVEVVVATLMQEILKTQRTFLIEVDNLTQTKRLNLTRTILKAGYKPMLVWVQTETFEAKRRASKPLPNGSGLNSDEFDAAIKNFNAPLPKEKPVVISGKHTYATQLKVVLKKLAGTRPNAPIAPPSPRRSGNIVVR